MLSFSSSLQLIFKLFRNVLEHGFTEQLLLEDSDKYDCTLCACVADIDWDGENEILIGTYGQVSYLHSGGLSNFSFGISDSGPLLM